MQIPNLRIPELDKLSVVVTEKNFLTFIESNHTMLKQLWNFKHVLMSKKWVYKEHSQKSLDHLQAAFPEFFSYINTGAIMSAWTMNKAKNICLKYKKDEDMSDEKVDKFARLCVVYVVHIFKQLHGLHPLLE